MELFYLKDNVLVSGCLMGIKCRYDGKSKPNPKVMALKERYNLISVCPEVLGGLKIPHPPSEQRNGGVYSENGEDLTEYFVKGAEKVLEIARENNCSFAILKEKSPSCGTGRIYDGTFSGTLKDGYGVTAKLLLENGIKVIGESEV